MKILPSHDFPAGPIKCCQVCGSSNLELVMDLGHQPLCDTLPSAADLNKPEKSFPLRQFWCPECSLSQLDYVVPGEEVYYPEYPYRSGITKELAAYQQAFADEAIKDLDIAPDSLIVDIGSNDGTLLKNFKARGMRVLGVEPTNIGDLAVDDGVDTIKSFFDEETARQIVESRGHPKLVTATNVFAHMATLGQVIRGLEVLLEEGGFFVLENHYLLSVMETGQFDTIYHEHLRTYSLKSIIALFSFYDFSVVDARRVSRYGGNIRVAVAKGKGKAPSAAVAEILAQENAFGLSRPEAYVKFRELAERAKIDLLELALSAQRQGKSFVGNSCPGRCSTLLNYVGIDRGMMPYIGEQPTSLKLGKFLPGKHIPIVNNQRLLDEQPDYVVLLAWHYGQPIAEQLRARGLKSKLIMPLPVVQSLNI